MDPEVWSTLERVCWRSSIHNQAYFDCHCTTNRTLLVQLLPSPSMKLATSAKAFPFQQKYLYKLLLVKSLLKNYSMLLIILCVLPKVSAIGMALCNYSSALTSV